MDEEPTKNRIDSLRAQVSKWRSKPGAGISAANARTLALALDKPGDYFMPPRRPLTLRDEALDEMREQLRDELRKEQLRDLRRFRAEVRKEIAEIRKAVQAA